MDILNLLKKYVGCINNAETRERFNRDLLNNTFDIQKCNITNVVLDKETGILNIDIEFKYEPVPDKITINLTY